MVGQQQAMFPYTHTFGWLWIWYPSKPQHFILTCNVISVRGFCQMNSFDILKRCCLINYKTVAHQQAMLHNVAYWPSEKKYSTALKENNRNKERIKTHVRSTHCSPSRCTPTGCRIRCQQHMLQCINSTSHTHHTHMFIRQFRFGSGKLRCQQDVLGKNTNIALQLSRSHKQWFVAQIFHIGRQRGSIATQHISRYRTLNLWLID